MAIKKKTSEIIGTVLIYGFVTLFSLSIIMVFLNLIAISLSNRFYVQSNSVSFWPRGLTFDAYRFVLVKKSIYTAYSNTIFVVIVGLVILIKKNVKAFKTDERPKSEKEIAAEEVNRLLETVDEDPKQED